MYNTEKQSAVGLQRRYTRNSSTARCVKRPFNLNQSHPLLCQSTQHIG